MQKLALSLMNTKQAVKASIQRDKLLQPGDRVLVAVSGGPDSVALLHLLHELKDELHLHLEVAHLQHGIRGREAKHDARFVEELANDLKLSFHLRDLDLPRIKSDAGKGNLEALARAERYRFFAEVVIARNLSKVAVAHTQDDQAETVLMWFLRGAGVKGLGGMAPQQQLWISCPKRTPLNVIRPLMEVSKVEVLEYLAQTKRSYRIDQSNRDGTLLRNWIRLELLPKIKTRAGAGFSARLSQQAALLRDEEEYLSQLTKRRYDAVRAGARLLRGPLLEEPKALQRRILRHWIEQMRGHLRGIDFVHIEALLRLIAEGPAQGRLSVSGGWECVREYEQIHLQKRLGTLPQVGYSYDLRIGTPLRISEASLELQAQLLPASAARLPADLTEAVFDAACLTGRLLVRNFRRGDRFRPLGMAGHKKLKDLFIEKKIPLPVRARLPLLLLGKEILWIPGYGRSQSALVGDRTTMVVHMKTLVDRELIKNTI